MAGGVGSRFWPKSTAKNPKQFQDVLGIGKSLLRLTFERMQKISPNENIYILTSTETYILGIRSFFEVGNVYYALTKTVVFGFLIVSVSSFYGYYVKGGALDVGHSSTKAVVTSSVTILIANFILTQMILL